MEIFLIKTVQFLMSISLLVLLHEGGHCFFAKLFGIRVEKFYMFFDYKFSLFSTYSGWWRRLIGKQPVPKKENGDPEYVGTEYGIGWIPLGGYCKIAGMIDESFDTEQMKQPAQPWEFRTHPTWQRLLVMVGGVLVNFLLALFIYSMVMFTWGEEYIKPKDMTYGFVFNDEAKKFGFQDGDILVGTEKGEFKQFDIDFYRDLAAATAVDIIRNGEEKTIALPGDLNLLDMIKNSPRFTNIYIPNRIGEVAEGSPAQLSGIKEGDEIVEIDGKPVKTWYDVTDNLGVHADMLATATTARDSVEARIAHVVVLREGQTDSLVIKLDEQAKIGVFPENISKDYKVTTVDYGFFASFPAGVAKGMKVLDGYVSDLKYLASADGVKSIGGFGTLGSLFPSTWDWYQFWMMTAFLSIILAFMNILPIPALDGGHVLFLLYEMITRRTPSEKFLLYAEYVGFGLVILLLVVANLNDVLRVFGLL